MRNVYPWLLLTTMAAVLIAACAGVVGTALWYHREAAGRESVGFVLIYEIVPTSGPNAGPVDAGQVAATLDARINAGRERVAAVEAVDAWRIRVDVCGRDPQNVERIARLMSRVGTLEFRVLANGRDHAALIERALGTEEAHLSDANGELLAWWVPVEKGCEGAFRTDDNIATRALAPEGDAVLVVKDYFDVDGSYLASTEPGIDARGRPCVDFVLDRNGGKLFSRLTSVNLPDEVTGFARRLGIILDGRLHSAPRIQVVVPGAGQITGKFTREEVRDLAAVLNAGALPARLRLISRRDVERPQ